MNKEKWWLVSGVIVEWNKKLYYIINEGIKNCSDKNEGFYIRIDKNLSNNLKPTGIPFDCIPEWAGQIIFNREGGFHFMGIGVDGYLKIFPVKNNMPYKKCPEAWKNKIFKITPELRELIK